MKAGEILISGIFNGSRLLEVPFYQRAYVWGEEQWERLLEDLAYVSRTRKPYFLGSIILKSGRKLSPWEPYSDCRVIIDGQQRITTLMIFMKVLCLLKGQNKLFEHDFLLEDGAVALRHGRNDIEAFQTVIEKESAEPIDDSAQSSQIYKAYNYFLRNVVSDSFDRTSIKQNVQFVCIDLADDEDEQQVFDTINSLGVKLTTAELLKNYFFNRNNVAEYQEKWVSVFEKDDETRAYWDMEVETGRYKRSLIDIFFDAYFQIFIQDKKYGVSAEDKKLYERVDRLSKSYKHFVDNYCSGDVSIVLTPLKEYANCFAQCFTPGICNMSIPSSFGVERMNIVIFGLKNTTLIPYLLYIHKNVSDPNEINAICGLLEGYIMRRMIVHATTKNYNNLFTSLILNGVQDLESLRDRLNAGTDATTYVPTDADVRNSFHTAKLVNSQTKGILYLLESGIRPANCSTALLGFNGYSLEHLMPKKWRNNWQPCQTEEQAKERDSIILTLGNLAIITQSLNASIRDADWNTKREGKKNRPGLDTCASGIITLADALSKNHWDEVEIQTRAEALCEQALMLWKI